MSMGYLLREFICAASFRSRFAEADCRTFGFENSTECEQRLAGGLERFDGDEGCSAGSWVGSHLAAASETDD